MSSYQTLLSVAVEHRYHVGGRCNCLEFQPTRKTRAGLAQAGLLLRNTEDGIQLVCDKHRLEALRMMARDTAEPLSFDFRVYSSDPEFRNYTEPFTDVIDAILYFDNRRAIGKGDISLTDAETAGGDDFRPPAAAEFEDVLEPRDRLLTPVFVLRLYAECKRGALLQQWLEDGPTTYRIRFDSRRRYWKYYLLGRIPGSAPDPGFFIDDADQQIEFESVGEEILAGSKRAFTFRSKQQIPLNARYRYRFQLKQKGQNGDTVLIRSLPFASIRQVGMETIEQQQAIVSEIYVNS